MRSSWLHRPSRGRPQLAGLFVVLLALGAAGCGSSSGTHGKGQVTLAKLTAAIERTRAISSAHLAQRVYVASSSGNEHLHVEGSLNFKTTTGVASVASSEGEQERTVFSNGTVWLTSDESQFKSALPAGKTWVQSTTSELEQIGAFHALSDSLSILDALRGVERIHPTGEGTATFDFSLARALARTPADRRELLETAIHANGTGLRETGSVALSSTGIVRSENLQILGSGQTAGLQIRYSFSLSNIGAPVSVTPPPSSEVVPLSSVPALEQVVQANSGSA